MGVRIVVLSETKIRCFLCAADIKNLTKTANKLFMTPQSVSKHILELERMLGFSLFKRSKNEIALTEAGESCARIFSKFINSYDEFVLKYRPSTIQNVPMKIGLLNLFNFGSAPIDAIKKMLQTMPLLDVVLERHSPSMLLTGLTNGNLDAILTHKHLLPENSSLPMLDITNFPIVLVVAAANSRAHDYTTFQDFANETLLIDALETETSAVTLARAKRLCILYGLKPKKIIIVPNRETVYSAVEQGQGIAIAPRITLMNTSSLVKTYPIDQTATLVCAWITKDNNIATQIQLYANYLQQAILSADNEKANGFRKIE